MIIFTHNYLNLQLLEPEHYKSNKIAGAPHKDSDQSESLLSPSRRFGFLTIHDAQAVLSLHWSHRSFCYLCHALAHRATTITFSCYKSMSISVPYVIQINGTTQKVVTMMTSWWCKNSYCPISISLCPEESISEQDSPFILDAYNVWDP